MMDAATSAISMEEAASTNLKKQPLIRRTPGLLQEPCRAVRSARPLFLKVFAAPYLLSHTYYYYTARRVI